MNAKNQAMRRGLRMAAQVAAMGALALATTGVAKGSSGEPSADSAKGADPGAVGRVAETLRVGERAGGCVPSWGPPSPPACSAAELDRWLAEAAS